MSPRPVLLFVLGTRPEGLKLAPLILLAKKDRRFTTRVCLTAQHREMADQVLQLFKIKADYDLDLMREGQTLPELTQRIFPRMHDLLMESRPDLMVVQGDTTTALAVTLQAFYEKIPVAHIEAGLRTYNKHHPFPEEINRVLISHLADYHFAPTPQSRQNLLQEGISSKRIFVTGNTVVDALQLAQKFLKGSPDRKFSKLLNRDKLILVTAHRRENFGKPLEGICTALRKLTEAYKDIHVVYPVHRNPRVRDAVYRKLAGRERIHLFPPLDYAAFLHLMKRCYLILTDSGGIQEEAPSFGKPVLVMRETTERPDGVKRGVSKLVGTSPDVIIREAGKLIENRRIYKQMVCRRNPYGDGKASERILNTLARFLIRSPRP